MANIKKTKQNIQKFFYCFHKLDSSTFEKKTEKYKNKFIRIKSFENPYRFI